MEAYRRVNLVASLLELRRQQRWWTWASFIVFSVSIVLVNLIGIAYDLGYLPHLLLAYVPTGVVIVACSVWFECLGRHMLGKRRREAALQLSHCNGDDVFWPLVGELFMHPAAVDQAVRDCVIRLAPWILDCNEVVTPEQSARLAAVVAESLRTRKLEEYAGINAVFTKLLCRFGTAHDLRLLDRAVSSARRRKNPSAPLAEIERCIEEMPDRLSGQLEM